MRQKSQIKHFLRFLPNILVIASQPDPYMLCVSPFALAGGKDNNSVDRYYGLLF